MFNIQNLVLGLDSRLRYALADREKTTKQIEQSKREIVKLEDNLRNFAPATDEIEKVMRERDTLIQNVKERMNRVEDTVFAEFCSQIGVANIRQYEERELRSGLINIFERYLFVYILHNIYKSSCILLLIGPLFWQASYMVLYQLSMHARSSRNLQSFCFIK